MLRFQNMDKTIRFAQCNTIKFTRGSLLSENRRDNSEKIGYDNFELFSTIVPRGHDKVLKLFNIRIVRSVDSLYIDLLYIAEDGGIFGKSPFKGTK